MLRFQEKKVAKKKVLCCKKKKKKIKAKTNSKYSVGYLDKTIRPLVLIMPNMSGYVQTFKVKEG